MCCTRSSEETKLAGGRVDPCGLKVETELLKESGVKESSDTLVRVNPEIDWGAKN